MNLSEQKANQRGGNDKMKPIAHPPAGLRQAPRRSGWHIWWEPTAAGRAAGLEPVTLDDKRLTWSVRQAQQMAARQNKEIARRKKSATRLAQSMTVADLINAFQQRSDYQIVFAAETQANNTKIMQRIRATKGATPVDAVTKASMRAWYEDLLARHGLAVARNTLMKMSALMGYAELRGWRDAGANPCHRLDIPSATPRDRVASWDELDALTEHALAADRPLMAAAVMMAVFTSQRQADLLRLEHDAVQNGQIRLIRSKRGNAGSIYIHPNLAPWLDRAAELSLAQNCPTILMDERTGRPWNQDTFGKVFRTIRSAAAETHPAITGLQFRDLRRTFADLAREGGALESDIGATLGNGVGEDPRITRTYLPANAAATKRAVMAIKRAP